MSVELADQSGDAFWRMALRTTLSDALHKAGRLSEAEGLFIDAEVMQKERQPQYPLLYSIGGFRYSDLLLGQGKYHEVKNRAGKTLEIAKKHLGLLDIALDYLSLGRASLLEAAASGKGDYNEAEVLLIQAVDGLRESGYQYYIPLGLLARASLYRHKGEFDRADADLAEAFTISEQGGMGLHLADSYLECARVYLARGNRDKARESLEKARAMIDEMGYHRRDREVRKLEKALR